MLEVALAAGIKYFDFWDMTIGEIITVVQHYQKAQLEQHKHDLAMQYSLSICIATAVGNSMNGKPMPPIYEIYPDFFTPPENRMQEEDNSWMLYKEQLIDFAQRHNNKKKRRVKPNDS